MYYNTVRNVFIGWGILVVVTVIGWILNIIKVVNYTGEVLEVEFVLRVVGIPFAPLGVIMGYFV